MGGRVWETVFPHTESDGQLIIGGKQGHRKLEGSDLASHYWSSVDNRRSHA